MTVSNEDLALDARRRRARFRSWHRGMREMDLILGPFADAEIAALTPGELEQYEELLELLDVDLLDWITAKRETPPHVPGELLARVSRRLQAMAQAPQA